MGVEIVLVSSVVLQLVAAIAALRLIRITGAKAAWGLIAAAVVLMVARRAVPLYQVVTGDPSFVAEPALEWVGFVISACMLAGLAGIASMVDAMRRKEAALAVEGERLAVTLLDRRRRDRHRCPRPRERSDERCRPISRRAGTRDAIGRPWARCFTSSTRRPASAARTRLPRCCNRARSWACQSYGAFSPGRNGKEHRRQRRPDSRRGREHRRRRPGVPRRYAAKAGPGCPAAK